MNDRRYPNLRLLSTVQRVFAFVVITLAVTFALVFFGLVFMQGALAGAASLTDTLFVAVIAAVGAVAIMIFGILIAISLLAASDRNILHIHVEENTRPAGARGAPAARPTAPAPAPTPARGAARPTARPGAPPPVRRP